MNTKIKTLTGVIIIIVIAITTEIFVWKYYSMNNVPDSLPPKTVQDLKPPKLDKSENSVGIANPASVFCEESNNAGKLEIRTGKDGEQIGFCKFFDSSECEEWEYFRGECKPGFVGKIVDSKVKNWQTYRNEKYGFEFSLPKYAMYKRDEFMNGYTISLGLKDYFGSVSVWDTTTYSLDKLKDVSFGGTDPDSIKENKNKLDGNPAVEISFYRVGDAGGGGGQGKKTVVLRDNLVYIIDSDENYEKIISTFKFIN